MKALDSKRAFIGFSARRDADAADLGGDDGSAWRGAFRGHFLDLRTLAFALTSRGHSLASACDAFGVVNGKAHVEEHGRITADYVAYCRQDVGATEALLAALRREYDRHPIALPPTKAFSSASIAKAYLKAMGLTPAREQFPTVPNAVLGAAMAAYYGGRAECRIRRTPVPVVYCDFLSMYPTVNTLLGLWELLTAEALDVVDATEELRTVLARATVERGFDPSLWRQLGIFAEVRPAGDILPVRAQYGDTDAYNIGVNHLTSDRPMWYAAPDLVASTLLTGKAPEIVTAFRLVPRGRKWGSDRLCCAARSTRTPGRRTSFAA